MKLKRKKISTSLPEHLLKQACSLTNLNQTETLIAGLRELIAHEQRKTIIDLKGKIHINLDLNKIRQRVRL